MIWLGVILAGLLTSVLYARYIRAIGSRQPGRAALADFGLMLMGSITSQAWLTEHGNFYVLLLFDVVAAIGTYWAVKRG